MKFLISLFLSAGIFLSATPSELVNNNEQPDSVPLPVFMYHRLLKNPTSNDIYTISPDAFEKDLIHLRDNGYTTVGTQELLAYAERGVPLPEKPVVLTFDDGYYNNVYYAESLLQKYGMKAMMFVVGRYSDQSSTDNIENPNYSYIRWERMECLPDNIEIQNHTWDMHRSGNNRKGIKRKSGESREDYERALSTDLKMLNDKVEQHTGKTPVAFAVPFGAEEEWSENVLESQGIKMCFCSRNGVSKIKRGDVGSLRMLKRMVRTPEKNAAALLKKYM